MIIKDYRTKALTTKEFIDFYFNKDKEDWCNLSEKIDNNLISVDKVDINELFSNKLSSFGANYHWICKTFKSYLKKVNPDSISKSTFSELLTLENEDKEYIDILKTIVNATNKFNNMYFYDYEDNNYNNDKTKELILEKVKDMDISIDNLYYCYPHLLFKSNEFNPTLFTSLNSENCFDEEYYEKVEYRVVLV